MDHISQPLIPIVPLIPLNNRFRLLSLNTDNYQSVVIGEKSVFFFFSPLINCSIDAFYVPSPTSHVMVLDPRAHRLETSPLRQWSRFIYFLFKLHFKSTVSSIFAPVLAQLCHLMTPDFPQMRKPNADEYFFCILILSLEILFDWTVPC